MSRIGVVSVHYYPEHLSRSLSAAADLAKRCGAERLITVSNSAPLFASLQQHTARLGLVDTQSVLHDNRGLEFGAFQAGLDVLLPYKLDWILFANDTFSIHNCFSTVFRRHLLQSLERPVQAGVAEAAGQVEWMDRSYVIGGLRTHRWLTTSVFALNAEALRVLGERVYQPVVDALIRDTSDRDRFFSAEVDSALVAHIGAWLFEPSPHHSWYGAKPLDEGNAARFAAKARSILHEKHLSAVLDSAGTWFFDIKGRGARDRIQKRFEEVWFRLMNRRPRGAHPHGSPGADAGPEQPDAFVSAPEHVSHKGR